MKELTCEMCGSNNVIKQEGLFVCQICNTKYSVEEAKKIMFEGTVKIDHSDELNNLYTLARRARDNNKYGEMCEYYNQILLKDPNSWEANFYPVYYLLPSNLGLNAHSLQTKEAITHYMVNKANYLSNKINRLIEILEMVLNFIKDYSPEKQQEAIQEIFEYTMSIFEKFSNNLDILHQRANGVFSNKSDVPYYNCKRRIISFYNTFANILISNFDDTFSKYTTDIWKKLVFEYGKIIEIGNKIEIFNLINAVANNIKQFEPDYEIPNMLLQNI